MILARVLLELMGNGIIRFMSLLKFLGRSDMVIIIGICL